MKFIKKIISNFKFIMYKCIIPMGVFGLELTVEIDARLVIELDLFVIELDFFAHLAQIFFSENFFFRTNSFMSFSTHFSNSFMSFLQ